MVYSAEATTKEEEVKEGRYPYENIWFLSMMVIFLMKT